MKKNSNSTKKSKKFNILILTLPVLTLANFAVHLVLKLAGVYAVSIPILIALAIPALIAIGGAICCFWAVSKSTDNQEENTLRAKENNDHQ